MQNNRSSDNEEKAAIEGLKVPQWFLDNNIWTPAKDPNHGTKIELINKSRPRVSSNGPTGALSYQFPQQNYDELFDTACGILMDPEDGGPGLRLQRESMKTHIDLLDGLAQRLASDMDGCLTSIDLEDLEDIAVEFLAQDASLMKRGEKFHGVESADEDEDGLPPTDSGMHGLAYWYFALDESDDSEKRRARRKRAISAVAQAALQSQQEQLHLAKPTEDSANARVGPVFLHIREIKSSWYSWKSEEILCGLFSGIQEQRRACPELILLVSALPDRELSTLFRIPYQTLRIMEPKGEYPQEDRQYGKERAIRQLKRALRRQAVDLFDSAFLAPHETWGLRKVKEFLEKHSFDEGDEWLQRAVRQIRGRGRKQDKLGLHDIETVLARMNHNEKAGSNNESETDEIACLESTNSDSASEYVLAILKKLLDPTKEDDNKDEEDKLKELLRDCLVNPASLDVTFDTVIIGHETKEAIQQLIKLSRIPFKAESHSLLKRFRMKGALFYGPPGTGKTHICRAIATMTNARMIAIDAATMQSKWIGETPKYIKAAFRLSTELHPCVLFIDEVDSLFYRRSSEDEIWQRQDLAQFLSEMDGLVKNENAPMVVVATNRPADLDDAFLRRLPFQVPFPLPDEQQRSQILRLFLKDGEIDPRVSIDDIAKRTEGFSGSDLNNVCSQAALAWIMEQADAALPPLLLENRHIEKALQRTKPSVSDQAIRAMEEFENKRGNRSSEDAELEAMREKICVDISELDAAIERVREVLSNGPRDPCEWEFLLVVHLSERHRWTSVPDDLKEAIWKAQELLSKTSLKDPRRVQRLLLLATVLQHRFEKEGCIADIDEAISLAEDARELTSRRDSSQAEVLKNLGIFLSARHRRTNSHVDIERSMSLAQEAVNLSHESERSHPHFLKTLSSILFQSFRANSRLGLGTLNRAIDTMERALNLVGDYHLERLEMLGNLGLMLLTRYEWTGNREDLNTATSTVEEALPMSDKSPEQRTDILSKLSTCYGKLYEETGNVDWLNKSVLSLEEALEKIPPYSGMYTQIACNLSGAIFRRYERTGERRGLEEAIARIEEAREAMPEDHPTQALLATNYTTLLSELYRITGDRSFHMSALAQAQRALDKTSADSTDRPVRLGTLAQVIAERYNQTHGMGYLEQAIDLMREAVQAMPEGVKWRAHFQEQLGSLLGQRYYALEDERDLDAAIQYCRSSLEAVQGDDPKRARLLLSLAQQIAKRRIPLRAVEDTFRTAELKVTQLNEAISLAEKATKTYPEHHPNQGVIRECLAGLLFDRYRYRAILREDSEDDFGACVAVLEKASNNFAARPSERLEATQKLIQFMAIKERWEDASDMARAALELLPQVCSRYLTREDQQRAIEQTAGFAAMACSVSLRAGRIEDALQQIEFGRGMLLENLIGGQGDIADLRREDQTLADEYDHLRSRVLRRSDARDDHLSPEYSTLRLRDAKDLNDCESRIRLKPGFENFLLPPRLEQLKQAAAEGPIVIVNVSTISSDAIIITEESVDSLELQGWISDDTGLLTGALRGGFDRMFPQIEERGSPIGRTSRDAEPETAHDRDIEFLSMLWSGCVQPILRHLLDRGILEGAQDHRIPLKRVWWIGTGGAASYPFHAAGDFEQTKPRYCMDLIIPSYTPSIRALIRARVRAERITELRERLSLLLVTMPETPDHSRLPGVDLEAQLIQRVVGTSGVLTVEPLTSPTAEQVLDHLEKAPMAHFACHGTSDTVDPSRSCLLFARDNQIDKLTIGDLMDFYASRNATSWLAFLSACSTAETRVLRQGDEGVNLASAFQFAGFAHVIGSLQPVDDLVSAELAEDFYNYLTWTEGAEPGARIGEVIAPQQLGTAGGPQSGDRNRAVAEALWCAMQILRIKNPTNPSLWLNFAHFGA